MAEAKTKPTAVNVDDYIAALADSRQRDDSHVLKTLMERHSGEPAIMWGPSIIGFGLYHYRYDSGRKGEMCRIGFAPRKRQTVVYLVDGYAGKDEQLARLGKHRIGKSCLYIRRLADVDLAVLEQMIADSVIWMAEHYPD